MVDTKALGLRRPSYTAAGDVRERYRFRIRNTSVAIVGNSNNTNPTIATFNFSGPAFKNVAVSVTLSTASDASKSLMTILTTRLRRLPVPGPLIANALPRGEYQASIVTDPNGSQRLQFTSSSSAFPGGRGARRPIADGQL